jgi:hypothetical protein
MKIFISLFLCLVMALSFMGCKKKEEKKQEIKKESCSECGHKIIEGTLYCVGCGESLGIDDEK